VAGLLLIITLELGGYCLDTKPDIPYRIDPLRTIS